MADVRGPKGMESQHDALQDVAETLGYGSTYGTSDQKSSYNHACMFQPREVLDRIYALANDKIE